MGEQSPRPSSVHNTVNGEVSGPIVQAGVVHGGVHYHDHRHDVGVAVPVVTRLHHGSDGANGTLVGRDLEVGWVLSFLSGPARTDRDVDEVGSESVVVSAVAGMGGVGKTALVRHCATIAATRNWFPGGVFWANLQGYNSEGVVAAAAVFSPLLRQLGLADDDIPDRPADQAAIYDQVLHELDRTGNPVLLILDNLSTADQVDGLLPTGGRHRVVITTRDVLALPDARRLSLDVLPADDAVTVVDRALRRQDPDDDRVRADPTGVKRLADVCSGLPLALLIAAGLLVDEVDLSPSTLASQLDRTSAAGFVHGETRLAAVFTASYDRLHRRDRNAARLLRLLALAPGPDIATDTVAALADIPVDRVRILLRTLRQAHLLATTTVDRWHMHDLVRGHTLDHPQNPKDKTDAEAACTRLLDYYLQTTDAADDHLRTLPGDPLPDRFTDTADALAWLDTEHANLVAAVHLAAMTRRHTHTVRLAEALDHYLDWRRHLSDLVTVNELALASAHHLDDPPTLADTWTYLGIALRQVRRFDEALTAHETACGIYHELGDRQGEGTAWNNLGLTLQDLRRFDQAITAHHKALAILQECGDRLGEGKTWNSLGCVLLEVRRFDEAITALERDLHIQQEFEDRHGEATAWNNLGLLLRQARRLDQAVTAHRNALDIYRQFDDRHREGITWDNLGLALQEVQQYDGAIAAHETALSIHADFGERLLEGTAWTNLGIALRQKHRFDDAIAALRTALGIHVELGDRHREASAWNNLGTVLQEMQRFDEAIAAHEAARAAYCELADRHGEGMALGNLGFALQKTLRFADARSTWQQALDVFRISGDTDSVERTLQLLESFPDGSAISSRLEPERTPGEPEMSL